MQNTVSRLRSKVVHSPNLHGAHLVRLQQGPWRRLSLITRAREPELDWEPEIKAKRSLSAPSKTYFPPRRPSSFDFPLTDSGPTLFKTRRDVVLTFLGGGALWWLLLNKVGINISDQPPSDTVFRVAGAADLRPQDFMWYKTPAGHWVAVSEDRRGRHFMIDEIGDLYYDTGDPQIGIYVMDRDGELFNWYRDTDGQRKITPVGNIADLRETYVGGVGGIPFDRPLKVVGFEDMRDIPLPPNAGIINQEGKFEAPGELIEGYTSEEDPWWRGPLDERVRAFRGVRPEVELGDRRSFANQLSEQFLGGKWNLEVER